MAKALSEARQACRPLAIVEFECLNDLQRSAGESFGLNEISVVVRLVVEIDLVVPFEAFGARFGKLGRSLNSLCAWGWNQRRDESRGEQKGAERLDFHRVTSVAQRAATIERYSSSSPIRNRYR